MLTGSPDIAEIEPERYPCLNTPLEDLQVLDLAREQRVTNWREAQAEGG